MKEKNFISAVIYIRNNEEIIKENLKLIYNTLNDNFEKFEIICVNDASNDNSIKQIKETTANFENGVASIINMSYYQGTELSINAGVDLAIGDFIYEFDTIDIDYNIDEIFKIYQTSLEGNDIVLLSPTKNNIFSKMFYYLFNKFSKNMYTIGTERLKVISRRAVNRINTLSKTIPYRKALYSNCGLKLKQIKYSPTKKVETFKSNDLAIDSLVMFTDIGYKATLYISVIMMAISVIMLIYILIIYFGKNSPIEGWTTTMLFLSFNFFILFILITIVIKYLSIILSLTFRKQKYLIESIEKITK